MKYLVRPSARAIKEIERMDRATMKRVQARIDELALNPFDHRLSKQLEMAPDRRYSRVGDWRLVFAVNEAEHAIEIAAVQHRSRVYKKLD